MNLHGSIGAGAARTLAVIIVATGAPGLAVAEEWPEQCTLETMPALSADAAVIPEPAAELVEAAVAEGNLVFYSAISEPVTVDFIVGEFRKTYPSVNVTWTTAGGGSKRRARFLAEAEAGQAGADVITDFSPGFFKSAFDEGYMVSLDDAIGGFSDIWPEDLIWTSDGGLTGVFTFSPFGFGYNTALVPRDLWPTSWEDLTKSEFKGHIQVKNVNTSSNTANHFQFLRETLGEDGFREFAENLSLTPLHTDAQLMAQELAAGGTWVMPQAQPNVIDAIASTGAPVKSVVPDTVGGSQYAVGIAANAANPNAAKLFAQWTYSAPGQWATACSMRSGSHLFPGYGPGNFKAYDRTSDQELADLNEIMGITP